MDSVKRKSTFKHALNAWIYIMCKVKTENFQMKNGYIFHISAQKTSIVGTR